VNRSQIERKVERAVMVLLNDPEWSQWSNAEIARRASVSNRLASILRAEILTVNGSQLERTYTTVSTLRLSLANLASDLKPFQVSAPTPRNTVQPP
jgi:hypothetical protein